MISRLRPSCKADGEILNVGLEGSATARTTQLSATDTSIRRQIAMTEIGTRGDMMMAEGVAAITGTEIAIGMIGIVGLRETAVTDTLDSRPRHTTIEIGTEKAIGTEKGRETGTEAGTGIERMTARVVSGAVIKQRHDAHAGRI